MNEIRIDANGVPHLSSTDIEMKAEEVIELFNPQVLRHHCETPILSFIEETAQRYNVIFDPKRDLGSNSHGNKILGKFCFSPRAILVDKSVEGEPQQKFILGHEFGHLVLHRKSQVKKHVYDDVDISDVDRDFVTGKRVLSSPRDWLEWQANRFSSAILMPRATLQDALIEVQKTLEIHTNVGLIYLDDEAYNYRDFQSTLELLRSVYQVTKTNLEIRLSDLGLLIDVRGKSTKHISELLMEE